MSTKITSYKSLKKGDFIKFNNKKEECVVKVDSINTSFFSDAADINCKCGKLDVLILSSDFKNGFISKATGKKMYYKDLTIK